LGFKILKEVENQTTSSECLKKSISKTVDQLYNTFRSVHKKRFAEQYDINMGILKHYNEGINDLKKYEVHPMLKKDGKQCLMDFYYDEA